MLSFKRRENESPFICHRVLQFSSFLNYSAEQPTNEPGLCRDSVFVCPSVLPAHSASRSQRGTKSAVVYESWVRLFAILWLCFVLFAKGFPYSTGFVWLLVADFFLAPKHEVGHGVVACANCSCQRGGVGAGPAKFGLGVWLEFLRLHSLCVRRHVDFTFSNNF